MSTALPFRPDPAYGASTRQPEAAVHPCAPAIVIGLGKFGRQVLAGLHLAAGARTGLPRPLGLWAGPAGWSLEWTGEVTDWPDPSTWWQTHAGSGAAVLQDTILRVLGAAELRPATLDIYLVAHLHEPFARELWPPVLTVARAASPPFADYVFTLILATDSSAFPYLPPAEARAVLASLDTLADELIAATDPRELPGRVGWCYLLDTLDTHGHPLKPLRDGQDNDPSAIQSHMVAEFIALLCAGLRQTPAYCRTSLADLRHDFRDRASAAWVSTFAAGSVVLPIPAIVGRARDTLAQRLLADHILGPDMPGDLPAARRLRTRWLEECPISASDQRNRIGRGRSGEPLTFSFEPPKVNAIPDDGLVNHLLNWDMLLWQRWHRPDAPATQMARNADALITEINAWLAGELNRLLQVECGGVRVAALFVSAAEQALEEEYHKPELPEPAEEHWLSALLAALRPHPPDPTALPDLEADRRRLQAALQRRLNRRAVWVRASLFAVILLSFAWAAYSTLGQALGLSDLLYGWRGVGPSPILDLVLLAATCWLLALWAGWVQLYMTDLAIHRATDRMIADIRRKYAALMERTLRSERERVYTALRSTLTEWAQAIASRRATLTEAVEGLANDLQHQPDPTPLLSEGPLLAPAGWSALFPELDATTCRGLAQRFLDQPDRPHWRAESGPALVAALRRFAEAKLSVWAARLGLVTWAAQPGGPGSLAALLGELRERIRPAWPLSREERAKIEVSLQRAIVSGHNGAGLTPVIVANFVGLPGTGPTSSLSAPRGDPWEQAFYTGEAGRLAFVSTLHALDLKRLRVWEKWRAIANEDNSAAAEMESAAQDAKVASGG